MAITSEVRVCAHCSCPKASSEVLPPQRAGLCRCYWAQQDWVEDMQVESLNWCPTICICSDYYKFSENKNMSCVIPFTESTAEAFYYLAALLFKIPLNRMAGCPCGQSAVFDHGPFFISCCCCNCRFLRSPMLALGDGFPTTSI